MMWLKGCTRCGGDLYMDRDEYGRYISCLQCGHLRDLEEPSKQSRALTPVRVELAKEVVSSGFMAELMATGPRG